jgi:hypothetical protein
MFGWFKKTPKVEDTEAYNMGQRFIESVNADLEHFMTWRFKSAFDGYLKILNDRFDSAYDSPEAPPITLARIDFNSFRENVQKMRPKMTVEVESGISQWLEAASKMGLRDDIQKLIDGTVGNFQERLTLTGMKAFIGRADDLKIADIKWRQANPELAAQFPLDNE